MFVSNHYYGHSRILRQYCHTTAEGTLPGRLQHGWVTGHGHAIRFFKEPWPKYVWSRRNLDLCNRDGAKNVVVIGAPFLYLPDPAPIKDLPPQRSLLAYPFHGWEQDELVADMERYARSLEDLAREGFGPITVCLYWKEYENPMMRLVFEKRGFSVTSNGHRDGNHDFLLRQRKQLLEHVYVTSNRVCTALFYGLVIGRKAFLHGPPMGLSKSKDPTGKLFGQWQNVAFPELSFEAFDDHAHVSIGERELGLEFKQSPDQLRKTLAVGPGTMSLHMYRYIQRRFWYFLQNKQ